MMHHEVVTTIGISRSLLARIEAHVAAEPGREACGLLFGSAGRIEDAVGTRNVSAHPADSFEVDPAALFAAVRAERAGGLRVIGHYHSHPSGSSAPSPRDAAAAHDEGRLWLILGIDGIGLWRAVRGGPVHGAFMPVELVLDWAEFMR